jgi:predicted Zn-dependent protease
MAIYGEGQAKAILDKAIGASKADQCVATLSGSSGGNIRYALNGVSTSGHVSDADLAVEVAFGKRIGTATTNRFDDGAIADVVRRAEELAKFAPENPEFVPAPGKQDYTASAAFAGKTAAITPQYRAQVAAACIEPCRRDGLVAAGFFADAQTFSAIANSRGNFGYQKSSAMDFTCTVRTEDGRGSGWVARNLLDVAKFDAQSEIRSAIAHAKASVDAKALEPGKYTVVFEPQALAPLMLYLGFDAREADEGRSPLSRKGGGNRAGERVFGDAVTLYSDPWDSEVPVLPWDDEGVARQRIPIVTRGKVESLQYSRYWAQQQGTKATGQMGNLVMAGTDQSTMDLVRGTRRGLLVTHTHYVNVADPQSLLLTGLTRDGTFYIEDGEIKHPVRNFRFLESVVVMLNNVEAIGRPERLLTMYAPQFPLRLPPLRVRDFTFTSLSDAV